MVILIVIWSAWYAIFVHCTGHFHKYYAYTPRASDIYIFELQINKNVRGLKKMRLIEITIELFAKSKPEAQFQLLPLQPAKQ